MCFHWQQIAADKLYEELIYQPIHILEQRLKDEIVGLKHAEEKAIEYHGSLDKCYHGFFAGNIHASRLNISAIKLLIEETEHGNGD